MKTSLVKKILSLIQQTVINTIERVRPNSSLVVAEEDKKKGRREVKEEDIIIGISNEFCLPPSELGDHFRTLSPSPLKRKIKTSNDSLVTLPSQSSFYNVITINEGEKIDFDEWMEPSILIVMSGALQVKKYLREDLIQSRTVHVVRLFIVFIYCFINNNNRNRMKALDT